MKTGEKIALAGGIVLALYYLNKKPVTAQYWEDNYKVLDEGQGEQLLVWNDQTGYQPISVDYPTFTGGTFLRPQYLPPVRTYHLQ